VLVHAYSFASALRLRRTEALVKVQVLLDKSQRTEKYSSADFCRPEGFLRKGIPSGLANAGISTKIDAAHVIAHNKVMIIDREIVITGSFNFSKAAEESNAENLLVIRDKELASRYIENWQFHDEHSDHYRPRAARKSGSAPQRKP